MEPDPRSRPASSLPAGPPLLVTVSGLKKSGKTTAAEALVAGLLARGFSTGAVKSIRHAPQPLDRPGTDTWRLARAGAALVIGQSPHETLRLERHAAPRSLLELAGQFPAGTQVVVSEGLEDPLSPAWYVVCLERPGRLAETLAARGLPGGRVVALAGRFAAGFRAGDGRAAEGRAASPAAAGQPLALEGLPVFDVLSPAGREGLLELLLERLGRPVPAGPPAGPLVEDPSWRPGLPAGPGG